LNNVPYWEISFLKSLKSGYITMECFEEGLELRSLEMLAHREMENHNIFFAQECSNDHVPFLHSTSLFIEGMRVHRMA